MTNRRPDPAGGEHPAFPLATIADTTGVRVPCCCRGNDIGAHDWRLPSGMWICGDCRPPANDRVEWRTAVQGLAA